MSKRRNKRNTRRGRAKRWAHRFSQSGRSQYRLRGTMVLVMSAPVFFREWCAFNVRGGIGRVPVVYTQTRAAAMRAAEHLARQASCR